MAREPLQIGLLLPSASPAIESTTKLRRCFCLTRGRPAGERGRNALASAVVVQRQRIVGLGVSIVVSEVLKGSSSSPHDNQCITQAW